MALKPSPAKAYKDILKQLETVIIVNVIVLVGPQHRTTSHVPEREANVPVQDGPRGSTLHFRRSSWNRVFIDILQDVLLYHMRDVGNADTAIRTFKTS